MEAGAALPLSPSISPSATFSTRETLTTGTPAPTTALIRPTIQATTSNYPKPSPPTFLYPQPIVPPHIYAYTMQRNNNEEHGTRPLHRSLAHKEPDETPTPFIAVSVFVIIAVAATWAVVVMLVHWRRTTTGMQPVFRRRRVSEQKGAKSRSWWTRMRRLGSRAEKGRYEVLRSTDGQEFGHVDQTHALSSAHDLSAQRLHDAVTKSPRNPFLVPPDQPLQFSMRGLKPRGSAEWAEARRAFFSAQSLQVQSRRSNSSSSLSGAELEDVEREAREAQGRRASLVRNQLEANMSWVDQGLAAVDSAVDRFAGRVIRWTDDGGKDEALLLPLAKGRQD